MTSPKNAADQPGAGSMLVSEQQLSIDTEWITVSQVRIRRRIVTETVQLSVTVRREELVFDEEPAPELAVLSALGQVRPLVTVLREEVPVVTLETRPYEQVRVSVIRVADEQPVTTSVQREQLELVHADFDMPNE